MKKFLITLLIFCFVAGTIVSFDYPENELYEYNFTNKAEWFKNDNWQPNNLFYFGGFDFKGYNPKAEHADKGLQMKIQAEVLKLKNAVKDAEYNLEWENGNFNFLGYSQGGLRSLASAAWMKENEPELYDKLNCVITVSGINGGLKALEGGVDIFAGRLNNDFKILHRGIVSTLSVIDPVMVVTLSAFTLPHFITASVVLYLGFNLIEGDLGTTLEFVNFLDILPGISYVTLAFRGEKLHEINDMVPYSNFILSTLAEASDEPKKVKIESGFKNVKKTAYVFDIWGIKLLPYTYTVREQQYKYIILPEGYQKLNVGSGMPIGYITGLESDNYKNNKDLEKTIEVLAECMDIVKDIHCVKLLLFYGYLVGAPVQYGDALSARDYLRNIDEKLNNLIGSSDNDGLVALESQLYSKSLHKNVLGGDDEDYIGYTGFEEEDHESINPSKNKDVQDKIDKMIKEAINKRVRE